MKESHWRATSLVLTTTLIILVASWASAQSRSKSKSTDEEPSMSQSTNGQVIIERDRTRYRLAIHASNTETDKYILYDSWDVPETKDIWFLEDPHKVRSTWKRIPFDKK